MYYVDKSLQENHPIFLGHVNDHFHYQNWWGHYFFFGLRPDPPLRPLVRDPRSATPLVLINIWVLHWFEKLLISATRYAITTATNDKDSVIGT